MLRKYPYSAIREILFFIFTVIGVVLSLYLGGCSSFDTIFTPEFDRGPNVKIKYYYAESQSEMDMVCRRHISDGRIVLGCAVWPEDPNGECWVYLYKNGSDDVKKHEEKHCRYGAWHVAA